MSISCSFAEDFQTSSLARSQELNTRSIVEQDFEGIVPGEKYWGLLKIHERGYVTINLAGAPVSQLDNWTLSIRFKKASNGSSTVEGQTGRVASFGLLCQPLADEPNAIDYTASVGLIMVGMTPDGLKDGASFAVLDGTLENFQNLSFFTPRSTAVFEPFKVKLPDASIPKITVPSVSMPSVNVPKIPEVSIPPVDFGALASSVKTSVGTSLSSVMSSLTNNPAVSKITSLLGSALGPVSKLVSPDTVSSLKSAASSMSANLESVATSTIGPTISAMKEAAKTGGLPNSPQVSASSTELQAAANNISAITVSIKPKIPTITPSESSSPFFTFVMTYSAGRISIVLDGESIKSFDISDELMVALTNKPFVIGCETQNVRLQLDNISFSGNG